MSIYRHVHINYWQDAFILDLTPEEKYFYIYLLTNSKTKQCGIYELPIRIIETETGYNRETVDKLLNRFEEYNKIVYDKNTKEIYLKNWTRHNKITSVKVKKCVEKELTKVKSQDLIKQFLEEALSCGYEIDFNIENQSHATANKDLIAIDNTKANDIKEYAKLYEQNVGLINGVIKEWLVEIKNSIDVDTFKRAIEIATDKGKCNKGYINGIINQWINNNIKTIKDLNAFELSIKNKGENNLGNDESIYSKPTEEQLQEARKLLNTI